MKILNIFSLKNPNLTKRTLTYIIIPLLVISILSVVYQVYFISSNFKSQEDKKINDIGSYLMPSIAKALWDFQTDSIKIIIDNSVKYNHLKEIVILNKKGEVVYSIADMNKKLGSEKKPIRKGIKKELEIVFNKKERLGKMEIYYSYDTINGIISKFSTTQVIIFLMIFITIVAILYFSLKAVVIKPINNMNIALKDLAEGEADLTQRLIKERNDEIGYGIELFNKFIERIQNIIKGVKGATGNVFEATEKLSRGNEDLANRTTELAASITETSVTMEEFTSSVKLNTDNAEEADKTLDDFNKEIRVKRELIDNVTNTMKEITDSSKKIDNIVSVINDISFQTNLLALNAAVEAARAGEAGRGFAVVASEVRNLAGKTAESSKSIQEIVTANVGSTKKGMELVNETSELFSKIVEVMEDVVNKINTITAGSREQTTGIDQINTTIAQMDSVSNQNASFVNEMSETSKNLKSSALELQELISQFKLN